MELFLLAWTKFIFMFYFICLFGCARSQVLHTESLAVAGGSQVSRCHLRILSCGRWDLVPNQGSNLGPLHWASKPLDHQGKSQVWNNFSDSLPGIQSMAKGMEYHFQRLGNRRACLPSPSLFHFLFALLTVKNDTSRVAVERPVWEGTARGLLPSHVTEFGSRSYSAVRSSQTAAWTADLASQESLRQNHPSKSLPDS